MPFVFRSSPYAAELECARFRLGLFHKLVPDRTALIPMFSVCDLTCHRLGTTMIGTTGGYHVAAISKTESELRQSASRLGAAALWLDRVPMASSRAMDAFP